MSVPGISGRRGDFEPLTPAVQKRSPTPGNTADAGQRGLARVRVGVRAGRRQSFGDRLGDSGSTLDSAPASSSQCGPGPGPRARLGRAAARARRPRAECRSERCDQRGEPRGNRTRAAAAEPASRLASTSTPTPKTVRPPIGPAARPQRSRCYLLADEVVLASRRTPVQFRGRLPALHPQWNPSDGVTAAGSTRTALPRQHEPHQYTSVACR